MGKFFELTTIKWRARAIEALHLHSKETCNRSNYPRWCELLGLHSGKSPPILALSGRSLSSWLILHRTSCTRYWSPDQALENWIRRKFWLPLFS